MKNPFINFLNFFLPKEEQKHKTIADEAALEIVYSYKYKGFLLLERDKAGHWYIEYNIRDVFNHINKNRAIEQTLSAANRNHVWMVARGFQAKVDNLIEACEIDFQKGIKAKLNIEEDKPINPLK